jgi:hypothetical protein
MLGRATEMAAKRSGIGIRVMPFPVLVILDNFGLLGKQVGISIGSK